MSLKRFKFGIELKTGQIEAMERAGVWHVFLGAIGTAVGYVASSLPKRDRATLVRKFKEAGAATAKGKKKHVRIEG